MASLFSHALAAYTIGKSGPKPVRSRKFLLACCACAMIPDLDVVMFNFVPYDHFLGHRGFFHSMFFCMLLAVVFTLLFFRKRAEQSLTILYLFLCGTSHALLDMLTNGGLGVAIFSPFDNERYFFPFRPIKVSPIGVKHFFSQWGLNVILSEVIWIGIPCVLLLTIIYFSRRSKNRR
jgi:inner membrane protein